MVEKVREAVCRVDPYCSDAEAIARAAIEALMEPTDEMLESFTRRQQFVHLVYYDSRRAEAMAHARKAWSDMLSAALERENV